MNHKFKYIFRKAEYPLNVLYFNPYLDSKYQNLALANIIFFIVPNFLSIYLTNHLEKN